MGSAGRSAAAAVVLLDIRGDLSRAARNLAAEERGKLRRERYVQAFEETADARAACSGAEGRTRLTCPPNGFGGRWRPASRCRTTDRREGGFGWTGRAAPDGSRELGWEVESLPNRGWASRSGHQEEQHRVRVGAFVMAPEAGRSGDAKFCDVMRDGSVAFGLRRVFSGFRNRLGLNSAEAVVRMER